jgi:glycosyltransferase
MKISIITASYNSAITIHETLKSVSVQNYDNIEHIVIDGGSTDATVDILRNFPNRNMRYVSETDEGIYDALNKGIKMADGDIVGFLHSNDRLLDENVISKIAEEFTSEFVEAVYGGLLYIDGTGKQKIVRKWAPEKINKNGISFGQMPPHPTLYFRKEVYQRIGLFDTKYKISSDYDFILRYFNNQIGLDVCINEYLYEMKIGGVSNTGIYNQIRKLKEEFFIVKSHKMNIVSAIVGKKIRKLKQLW